MQNRILPPEVCARIVRHTSLSDLPALCRTSRIFQEVAEQRLYHDVYLQDPHQAERICNSLLAYEGRRAAYLRFIHVDVDTRLYPRYRLPEHFWRRISDVFLKADNLDYVYMADPEACRSWILDPSTVHFQLREAMLSLSWNKHLVAFLQTQKQLRSLFVYQVESLRDNDAATMRRIHPMAPDSLPGLTTLEAPLLVATELLSRPLRQVQAPMDEDGDILLAFLSKAAQSNKTLRSLNVHNVPDFLVSDALRILANSPLAAYMRHIGILQLPLSESQRCGIHRSLMKFAKLEMLQVNITHWQPMPMSSTQRMVVTELGTYCPSLRLVQFWHGPYQILWRCDNEHWVNVFTSERRQDMHWRNF